MIVVYKTAVDDRKEVLAIVCGTCEVDLTVALAMSSRFWMEAAGSSSFCTGRTSRRVKARETQIWLLYDMPGKDSSLCA